VDGNLRATCLIENGVGYLVLYLEGGTDATSLFLRQHFQAFKRRFSEATMSTGAVVNNRIRVRLDIASGQRPAFIRIPSPKREDVLNLREIIESFGGQWLAWHHPVHRLI
jgi:hypothetical protein